MAGIVIEKAFADPPLAVLPLDCEASSLHRSLSWPVEVGWSEADWDDGRLLAGPEAHLVKPAAGWTDWSVKSQQIHGIPLGQLHRDGKSARIVAERLLDAARGKVVLVTHREDVFWLQRLMEAARTQGADPDAHFRLAFFQEALMARLTAASAGAGQDTADREWARAFGVMNRTSNSARYLAPPNHRAGPDSLTMATWWRIAVAAFERGEPGQVRSDVDPDTA